MTYARKSLISLQDTPYYHVVARCVRRSWLWGFDEYAGKDYSHRKAWVLRRLAKLSSVFAIEMCAYAVMSNHYHLVLRVNQRRAAAWTAEEVVARWTMLFTRPLLIDCWERGLCQGAQREAAEAIIERWRSRLCDISWYMRCLNEHLARRANAEDECTGRFWEGRFRSQALLDEAGLLAAMAYVDLNPVRAGLARVPDESHFTSIYQRVKEAARANVRSRSNRAVHPGRHARPPLLPFRRRQAGDAITLPFAHADYVSLLRWTAARPHGVPSPPSPTLMHTMNFDEAAWRAAMTSRWKMFGRAIGTLDRLREHADALGQAWVRGMRAAETLFCARASPMSEGSEPHAVHR